VVYVTSPAFFPSIAHIRDKKIIYDCMDDLLEFTLTVRLKTRFFRYEKKLIQKSYLVVFSSNYLKNVVEKRAPFAFSSIVVNNAIQIPEKHTEISQQKNNSLDSIFCGRQHRIISYIGTVSDWFDYDLLVKAANNKAVQFYIFGPVEHHFNPAENVLFFGPRRHDEVFYIMEKSDALIMPFMLTQLIQSVNPVKLYEYIYSGKPVISIRYEEALQFEKYVYLYNAGDIDSLQKTLDELERNNYTPKASPHEMRNFVLDNTWEKRIDTLLPYLNNYIEERDP
jgi:glycosyltransferase involved in cell wall biosynthesis